MSDAQIKHMAERFLSWKLPADFNPDGGVVFDPVANAGTPHEHRREPTGTNLLTYTQAEAMVRHMVEGVPGTLALIREWARDRNLIEGSNPGAQGLKMIEELGETFGALARLPAARSKGDIEAERTLLDKAADGFGDAVVVLTIMAAQVGLDLEGCIEVAYNEIKDRKGRMVDGVFVREGGEV